MIQVTRKAGAFAAAILALMLVASQGSAMIGYNRSPELDHLASSVNTYSIELDQPLDALPKVYASGIEPARAEAIADVLDAMLECQQLTESVTPQVYDLLSKDETTVTAADAPWASSVRACGEDVIATLDVLRSVMAAQSALSLLSLDLWPVLRYEPGTADNVHLHDYILVVDEGGDDQYYNNAGGTVVDPLRGPSGSAALLKEPARGCQTDQELNRGSGNCILSGAAAVMDGGGDDIYGRFETPQADSVCTSDLVMRRLATGGSGVAGVGILIDDGGDDDYLGKTLALGMGHAGGFGYLREAGGADTYSAIRSSIGSAVLVGDGILDERSGNDVYGNYDPAGGVIDNNGVCRAGTANLVGAGLIVANGNFRDRSGADTYISAAANALGSGDLGGAGTFLDESGIDTYVNAAGGRGNGVTIVGPTGSSGVGSFTDQ